MRVMIVDDSVVFRSQLKNCLEGVDGISVVATAANGKIALARLDNAACDLVILDLEMPEMNGLEFLRELRKRASPPRVIVFAAPTADGGDQVLDALEAGAADFIAKPSQARALEEALAGIRSELLPKVEQFKSRRDTKISTDGETPAQAVRVNELALHTEYRKVNVQTFKPRAIVIGSSTGGPTALEHLLSRLKGCDLRVPILIAQHMPANFTKSLAKRLGAISGIPSEEGQCGEVIKPGRIYVAPGDFHMSVKRDLKNAVELIAIDQSEKRNNVRPAVDLLFESAAREYKDTCAAFVLTGMGEDGKQGADCLKKNGGAVVIQDKASSIVWGMPGAIHSIGAYDVVGNLDECAKVLREMVS